MRLRFSETNSLNGIHPVVSFPGASFLGFSSDGAHDLLKPSSELAIVVVIRASLQICSAFCPVFQSSTQILLMFTEGV